MNKTYSIYVKNKCIYKCLSEEEFKTTWDMIDKFLSVSGVLPKSDISFKELNHTS